MTHKRFNKTLLAQSLSVLLGATAFAPAMAADADEKAEKPVEVVEVKGDYSVEALVYSFLCDNNGIFCTLFAPL